MKILAVDTSTMTGSIALLHCEKIISEWTLRSAQTHNRRLLKAIDFLLQSTGWDLNEIDAYAVTEGPGSFTGIRIGMTTIKTLAWTRKKLYAAIPSLDALASPFGHSAYPVCPMIDARKGEVYCALYHPDGKGNLEQVMPYSALNAAKLAEKITAPVIFCGDGWVSYKKEIKKKLGGLAMESHPSFDIIRAGLVGELAWRRFARGDSDKSEASVPLYVRVSEAEIHYPHLAKVSSEKPEFIQFDKTQEVR